MSGEPASGEGRDHHLPRALGKYVPFARLGSGGMAEVFLAVARGPVGFNKLAVVKRLRNSGEEAQVEMFLDEARLAARLNHANVVHTYDVGEFEGTYFIAMEYLEGQSLQALEARLHVLSEWLSDSLIAYIGAQALKGLHFAHELRDFDGTSLGVVHRDVSPHNLYLTYDGEVKLLDFGVAKATTNSAHTEIGMVKGKIRYMAPEQLGDGEVDRRADVFAFGVVLWELLARRPLFQGNAPSVMARIVGEDVGPVRTVRPDVSPELEGIAMKALRRNPDERYASADDMRAALETFLRGQGKDEAFDRELARVMNDGFAKVRDDARGRIKTFLANLRDPEDLAADESGATAAVFGRTSDLPVLSRPDSSVPPTPRPTPTPTPATRVPPIRRPWLPRWSWLLVVVGASVTGVVTLGRLGRQMQDQPTDPRSLAGGASALELAPASALASTSASASPPASASPLMPASASASALAPVSALTSAPVPAPVRRSPPTPLPPASARPKVNIRVLDDSDSP